MGQSEASVRGVLDMARVRTHVAALPDDVLRQLERGPLPDGDGCTVCRALREPKSEAERRVWEFHGNDAMRCGVIYGMACAVRHARWEAGIERMKREHPEAYR